MTVVCNKLRACLAFVLGTCTQSTCPGKKGHNFYTIHRFVPIKARGSTVLMWLSLSYCQIKTTKREQALLKPSLGFKLSGPSMFEFRSSRAAVSLMPDPTQTITQRVAWAAAEGLGLSLSISQCVQSLHCPDSALCFLMCPTLNSTNRHKTSYHASHRDNYIRNFCFVLSFALDFSLEEQRSPFIQFAAESLRLCKLLNHPWSFFLTILQAVNFHTQFRPHN